MDDNTTRIIKERFDALPESIKEIILSSNYEETVLKIGQAHQLNVEQLGILERETTMVMMGLTPPQDFQTELARELRIDNAKGAEIVKEINEKIFFKIRELLKLMNTPAGEEPVIEEDTKLKNTGADWDVMKSAGIEIVESPKVAPDIHPMLSQKMSGPSQSPAVTTEHTIETTTPRPANVSTPPKKDPYRLSPDE